MIVGGEGDVFLTAHYKHPDDFLHLREVTLARKPQYKVSQFPKFPTYGREFVLLRWPTYDEKKK